MSAELLGYMIGVIGFGTSHGFAIIARRQSRTLPPVPHMITNLAGLANTLLLVGAFLLFEIEWAIAVVAAGIVGTAVLATVLPKTTWSVALAALIGAAATVFHLAGRGAMDFRF